jgi:predicted phage gp36 major capsid-like protein
MARVKDEFVEAEADAPTPDPMEQVRELLFGEAKRTAEQNFQALDDKLEAMRADFLARFSALESRLVDLARDTEQNQAASVNAIGSAITQLGATVQNLSVRRKGG